MTKTVNQMIRLQSIRRMPENEVCMAEMKQEYIGKIKLDYTYYPGEDFYCDG